MTITVPAREFEKDIGHYLYQSRREVVAVTHRGVITAYIVSPDAYALLLQGHRLREQGHQDAVARMDAEWGRRG